LTSTPIPLFLTGRWHRLAHECNAQGTWNDRLHAIMPLQSISGHPVSVTFGKHTLAAGIDLFRVLVRIDLTKLFNYCTTIDYL